jgi:hypothetical protein
MLQQECLGLPKTGTSQRNPMQEYHQRRKHFVVKQEVASGNVATRMSWHNKDRNFTEKSYAGIPPKEEAFHCFSKCSNKNILA